MKVVILNTSDTKGGAAVSAYRLMDALCREGVDARMLVADRYSDDPRVACAGTPRQRKRAFLSERLKIFLANGLLRRDLFKVSTASDGMNVVTHPWVQEADAILINWINQGFLSLGDLQQLGTTGKKIFWTMHDMWCFTGICHHAYGCPNFEQQCGHCRFLRFPTNNDLSHILWKKKQRLYKLMPQIRFVAVSQWVKEQSLRSSLLKNSGIEVISNIVPVNRYDFHRSADAPADTCVIAMGAARLDDPVKGFPLMIEAVNLIADRHPDRAKQLRLMLFGELRDTSLLQKLKIQFDWCGPVSADRIPKLLQSCDVVLSSSHFETLGMTLAEGLAAGCMAVAFDHGGQSDIIRHRRNGYLATYPSAEDLANGILWASSQKADRQALHNDAVDRFSPGVIAQEYIRLIERQNNNQ